MSAEFYAISFILLLIVSHGAINLAAARLFPKSNQERSEPLRTDWEPLRDPVHARTGAHRL